MYLRMTLNREIVGFWDGGPREVFDFHIDGSPQQDARGRYIRVGCWAANHFFHVALGMTVKATLANARRRLAARAKHAGIDCEFTYVEDTPGYFERQAFGRTLCAA